MKGYDYSYFSWTIISPEKKAQRAAEMLADAPEDPDHISYLSTYLSKEVMTRTVENLVGKGLFFGKLDSLYVDYYPDRKDFVERVIFELPVTNGLSFVMANLLGKRERGSGGESWLGMGLPEPSKTAQQKMWEQAADKFSAEQLIQIIKNNDDFRIRAARRLVEIQDIDPKLAYWDLMKYPEIRETIVDALVANGNFKAYFRKYHVALYKWYDYEDMPDDIVEAMRESEAKSEAVFQELWAKGDLATLKQIALGISWSAFVDEYNLQEEWSAFVDEYNLQEEC